MSQAITDETMQRLLATSYRNFHAKGFDYVCMRRSPDLTLKIYFFDMQPDASGMIPEVVRPHDHRYDFNTAVIRGAITNTVYREVDVLRGTPYDRLRYYTPLNGGEGFAEGHDLVGLVVDNAIEYGVGQQYRSLHRTVHTLNKVLPGTILAVEQYADQVSLRAPTSTYINASERYIGQPVKRPDLAGLYDRFTADAMLARLKQLEGVSPGALSWLQG